MSLFKQSMEKWDYKAVILQMPTFVPTLGDTHMSAYIHVSIYSCGTY